MTVCDVYTSLVLKNMSIISTVIEGSRNGNMTPRDMIFYLKSDHSRLQKDLLCKQIHCTFHNLLGI